MHTGRPTRKAFSALAAAAAIATILVACGDDSAPLADRARDVQGQSQRVADAVDPTAALPERGRALVEYVDGLVTVRSNQAPLQGILTRLAGQAGFELSLGDTPLRNVTLEIERVALTVALPDILDGIDYGADFEADSVTGQRRVTRLWIGQKPAGGIASDEPSADDRLSTRIRERRQEDPRDRAERMRAREERLARMEVEQREAIQKLSSGDSRVRAEAASEIEPEGEGLNALLDLVYDDPDPAVRVAAVGQLEDGDTHAAVTGLISALNDEDRSVVLEAIDALEFAGDESVIPSLEPFLDSPDSEIREAAAEAIEFLE